MMKVGAGCPHVRTNGKAKRDYLQGLRQYSYVDIALQFAILLRLQKALLQQFLISF